MPRDTKLLEVIRRWSNMKCQICSNLSLFDYGIELIWRAGSFMPDKFIFGELILRVGTFYLGKFRFAPFHSELNSATHTHTHTHARMHIYTHTHMKMCKMYSLFWVNDGFMLWHWELLSMGIELHGFGVGRPKQDKWFLDGAVTLSRTIKGISINHPFIIGAMSIKDMKCRQTLQFLNFP